MNAQNMLSRLRIEIEQAHPGCTEQQIQDAIYAAMQRSVCGGKKLPSEVCAETLTYSETVTMFSNAGGMKVDGRQGGIRVTSEVAGLPDGKTVVVLHEGQPTAMTLEQAFERGLREHADWSAPLDVAVATREIASRVADAARAGIGARA